MFKYKIIISILLTAVFISGEAYCQMVVDGKQVSTISGKVKNVDVDGNVVVVQTAKGDVVFYISVQSSLFRYTHHMASVEIEPGDPVTVQYDSSSGKNIILVLTDHNTYEY